MDLLNFSGDKLDTNKLNESIHWVQLQHGVLAPPAEESCHLPHLVRIFGPIYQRHHDPGPPMAVPLTKNCDGPHVLLANSEISELKLGLQKSAPQLPPTSPCLATPLPKATLKGGRPGRASLGTSARPPRSPAPSECSAQPGCCGRRPGSDRTAPGRCRWGWLLAMATDTIFSRQI